MATPSSKPPEAAPAETPSSARKGLAASFMPALLAILAAPAATWAVCEFFLIPRLKAELGSLAAVAPGSHPAPAETAAGRGRSAPDSASLNHGYKFENIVVNLAGTMGTRYLKTTFLVTGGDAALIQTFESNRPVLVDVTLNVLSSLSLSDLEEAGAKNLIREKLVQSYNQALGRKVAEQVFFSDFVVQ